MTGRAPLWAPWRIQYVEARNKDGCVFCEPDRPRSDRDRLILFRGPHVFVLLNRYPYSPGHLMVAPLAHEGRLDTLEPEVQTELMARIVDCARILQATYECHGLNIGANLGMAAGAGFADHLHFHLVPRWEGDTNFMATVGSVRVIPDQLEQMYDRLAPLFKELSSP